MMLAIPSVIELVVKPQTSQPIRMNRGKRMIAVFCSRVKTIEKTAVMSTGFPQAQKNPSSELR